jgi:LemA protein
MLPLLISGGLLVLLLIFFIGVYNTLSKSKILVKEAWSGIGAYLQQRNDVIPNMVEIVKGYAGHENKTLTEVTRWRNKSAMASTAAEQNEASAGLGKALIDLYQVTENYPDLKANQNFLKLQEDLAVLENSINQSRRYYNGTVREFNQQRVVFPKNLVASMFGFNEEVFFKEDDAAHTVPKISF